MKNISKKNIWLRSFVLGTVLVFSTGTFTFAEELKDFSVWVAPEYKLTNSSFNHDSMNKNEKTLAEQNVDEKLLSYIGAEAGFSWRFISLQGTFDWGIPKSCGGISIQKYNEEHQNICYDTREYDASLDAKNFDIDTKLLFDIPVIRKWFYIRPYAGFNYYLRQINGSFKNGRRGWDQNYDISPASYNDNTMWKQKVFDINSAADSWFKREMYDIRVGTALHGEFFDRGFVDLDFAVSLFTKLNTKQFNGTMYYLDMMQDFFRRWNLGIGAGVYLGKQRQFEIGVKFNYCIMNALKGDTYYSTDENSDYKKFPDGTVTYTESLEETVIDEENATKDLAGNIIPDENGIIPTKNIWKEYSYTKNYSGIYAQTASQTWQLTIYGKYTFRFGPTHTPKVRPAREKKSKAPKVRKGKVDVIQY